MAILSNPLASLGLMSAKAPPAAGPVGYQVALSSPDHQGQDTIVKAIDELANELYKLSISIHGSPELGWRASLIRHHGALIRQASTGLLRRSSILSSAWRPSLQSHAARMVRRLVCDRL